MTEKTKQKIRDIFDHAFLRGDSATALSALEARSLPPRPGPFYQSDVQDMQECSRCGVETPYAPTAAMPSEQDNPLSQDMVRMKRLRTLLTHQKADKLLKRLSVIEDKGAVVHSVFVDRHQCVCGAVSLAR